MWWADGAGAEGLCGPDHQGPRGQTRVKGEAKFTSVGAELGPRGSPVSAVLKAQDGRALPQTNSFRGPVIHIHMELRTIHLSDPPHCTDEKIEVQRQQGTHSESHSKWTVKLRPDPVSSDSPIWALVTLPSKAENRAF